MDDVEIRELRYFVAVAVADALNFSHAAEALGIAQPPLSRAIAALERRIGARLLNRDTRRVELTAVGAEFLKGARPILNDAAALLRSTRRSAAGALAVTAKPGIASGLLKRIADRYSEREPAAPIEIVVSGYRHQAALVSDGSADVALLSSPLDGLSLEFRPVVSERRLAVMATDHPLARHAALTCSQLREYPIPRWPQGSASERAYWGGVDSGGDPAVVAPIGPIVHDPAELLEVVAMGQAVALVPESLSATYPHPGVSYRPVPDASPYIIAIAWRPSEFRPQVKAFIDTAMEFVDLIEDSAEGYRGAQRR